MYRNDLFLLLQHVFLRGRSCITQLITVPDDWTQILEEEGCIDSIFLDFQKAFDEVPSEWLLEKHYGFSIRGKVLRWVRMFLMD